MVDLEAVSLAGFAFVAGTATFFAPCAYPLLPGYVSYYLGRGFDPDGGDATGVAGTTATDGSGVVVSLIGGDEGSHRVRRALRAAFVGTVVSAGVFLIYGLLAGVVATVGARAVAEISVLELVVGLVLIGLGTVTAIGRTPSLPTVRLPARRRSLLGFFGFGVVYAIAAAGCTAPLFVGVAAQAVTAGPGVGAIVIASYAAGMATLMIGLTVAVGLGRDALLRRLTGRAALLRRVTGVLLVVAGVVQLYFYLVRFGGLAALGLA